ncbi:Inner membrane protein yqaA [Serratia fonticola]|uniref:Inner membrane protein yqaA n=1 Tax=Serratia fonticola TaxID=47917 RepID=A0A4V6Z2X5_SERFO|nr:Inner membrane protein yqaA [Serratia fonticola]
MLAATLGNTLGGLTNVIIGRLLPALKPQRGLETALGWLKRFGPAALLLSWVAGCGRFIVRVGRLAAHAMGLCHAVSVYRKKRCVTSS